MNNGFTLLELLVVIALLAITLVFSLPRLQTALIVDDKKKVSQWVIARVLQLKNQAVADQKQQTLHVDIDSQRFWVTDDEMPQEAFGKAKKEGYRLPKSIRVVAVEYADRERVAIGTAQIRFSKKSYNDFALIRMRDGKGHPFTFLIEPFLWRVRWYDDHIGF